MKNTDKKERHIILESHKKFSSSCIWRLQRNYFDQAGIDAWVNQVPFYITSNPYIAYGYAQMIISFIRDTIELNPNAKKHPFYILELGTGSGRFSFYVLKSLVELQKILKLEDISICYIMSDFTKNNIQYYETHPALQHFLKMGMIDFAIYDMETEQPIILNKKNIRLTPETLQNPLIVFANYIFDTISHDAFHVQNGMLSELLLSVSTPENNLLENQPKSMDLLEIDFKRQIIQGKYYQDETLNEILEIYKTSLTNSNFLFPIGSFGAIKLLKKFSENKLFIIASDKGYNTISALENLGTPSLSFHGSFSMMVNFHALATYFHKTGGDAFLQTPRKGIKTSIYYTDSLKKLPFTQLIIQDFVEGLSPADYFTLHRRLSDSFNECNLEVIAAHLNFSRWDPHIYLKLSNRINSLLDKSDQDSINFLASNMHKIAANYYYMPKSDCVLFEIAVFFHQIKRYADALKYYEQAQPFVGEKFGLFYNRALCEFELGFVENALEHFKIALTLDKDSKEAAEWIHFIEKKIRDN